MARVTSDEEYAQRIIQVLPNIMRALVQEARQQGPGKQITLPQFRVLWHLREREHAMGELARHHGVSLPTMTVMIDGLVRRGLVERTQRSNDRRTVILHITVEGRAILEEFRQRAVARVESAIATLDANERATLMHALEMIESSLSLPQSGLRSNAD